MRKDVEIFEIFFPARMENENNSPGPNTGQIPSK